MLLCNFRAIDRWPPLWARSAEIRAKKGGGLVMRTGALGMATPHRPDASQCAPTASACQPASKRARRQSNRLSERPRCSLPCAETG